MEHNKNDIRLALADTRPDISCSRFFLWMLAGDFTSASLITKVFTLASTNSNTCTTSDPELAEHLGLTYNQLRYSKAKLVQLGVLQTKSKGYPRKATYIINTSLIKALYDEYLDSDEINKLVEDFNPDVTKSLSYEENRGYEYPPEWTDKLRSQVKDRDHHKCSVCQSTSSLEVHHIDEDRQNCLMSNLITLCASCHKTVHGRITRIKNNKVKFTSKDAEFLQKLSDAVVRDEGFTAGLQTMICRYHYNEPIDQKLTFSNKLAQKPTSASNHKPKGNSATIEEEGGINNNSNNKPITTTSKKKKKKKVKITSIEYMLSELLFELIVERRPNYFGECTTNEVMKIKRLRSWAEHIILMFSQDKRSKDEIADTIEWSQQHYFWKDNILSTRKLRKNYGKLRIQMEKDEAINKRTIDSNPKITAEIIEHFEKAFLGKKVKWEIYDKGSFVIAAQRSVELANKSNLLLNSIPELLIKCLKKWQIDNNKPVEPSYVKTNHTWDVLFPQYFADIGISVCEEENL